MLAKLKNKKYLVVILGIVLMFVLFGQTAFAAGPGDTKEIFGMKVTTFQAALKGVLELLFFLAGALSAFAGWLMSGDWTSGAIFGMDDVFRNLWVLMSNVIYFIFAFLLVWIAFMNIVGRGGETYALKTALPKFIVGVLIVPFTWFIVQFTISASSVLTASILSLPSDIIASSELDKIGTKIVFPKDGCVVDLDKIKGGDDFMTCDTSGEKTNIAKFLDEKPFGIMYSYLYGVFNFQELLKLDTNSWFSGATAVSIIDIGVKILFNLVFFIVYMVILFALIIGLFIRTVYLWLYTIFSPVFGLVYFFGGQSEGEFMKKFNFKDFIGLALVPVYVAGALSFGLLFISIISTDNKFHGQTMAAEYENGKTELTLKPLSLTVVGNIFPEDESSGANPIARFIMYLIGVGVLRLGTMAAFKSSEVTKAAVSPIIQLGENVGGLMKAIPRYTPLPGAGLSMSSFEELSTYPSQAFEKRSSSRSSRYQDKVYKMMGLRTSINDYEITKMEQAARKANSAEEIRSIMEDLKEKAEKYGRNDPQIKKMEKTIMGVLEGRRTKLQPVLQSLNYTDSSKEFIKDGEITENAMKLIVASNSASDVNTYRRNVTGTGGGGETSKEKAKNIVKSWNNRDNINIIVNNETIKDDDTNDSHIRLVQTKDENKTKIIQTLEGGKRSELRFAQDIKLEKLTKAQLDAIHNLTISDEYLTDIDKILEGLLGVNKYKFEEYRKKYYRDKKEAEEKARRDKEK